MDARGILEGGDHRRFRAKQHLCPSDTRRILVNGLLIFMNELAVLILCAYQWEISVIGCICAQHTVSMRLKILCSALSILLPCSHPMFYMRHLIAITASTKDVLDFFLFSGSSIFALWI